MLCSPGGLSACSGFKIGSGAEVSSYYMQDLPEKTGRSREVAANF